jgi:integrase
MSLTTAVSSFKLQIWTWLEGRLAAGTQVRYQRARDDFALWQTRLGIGAAPLAPDQLDVLLAKYVLDIKEDCDTVVSRQQCIDLVASTQRRAGHPCRLAQQILKAWQKEVPPVQAEAMPAALAFAMVTTLSLVFKEQQAAVLVLLAFAGCLRIGEALGLRSQDVFLPRPGSADQRGVVILRATKRSFDQRVVIGNRRVVSALVQYQKFFAPPERDAMFAGMTYNKFARLFKKALVVLRVPAGEWRTHSLRRGAATALMEQGYSFEYVRLFGRWASEGSCREYIRLGQSALTRISGRISQEQWPLYETLGSAVDRAFSLAANEVS